MVAFYVTVALVSGAGLAIQVGLNNELRARLTHPILAALASFAIGTLVLVVNVAALRPPLPQRTSCGGDRGGSGWAASSARFTWDVRPPSPNG